TVARPALAESESQSADSLQEAFQAAQLMPASPSGAAAPPPTSRAIAGAPAATQLAAAEEAPAYPVTKDKKELTPSLDETLTDRYNQSFSTEGYDRIRENSFASVAQEPLSTFSIDVDTASYANVRRFIGSGSLPPPDAVRIEELVNYFPYDYAKPKGDEPFAFDSELAACPWAPSHALLRVALQAREISAAALPPSNLVFLVDVSGSMDEENKLPLVKASLKLLVRRMRTEDRIALVVYAGSAGLVLPPTPGNQKDRIDAAIDALDSGGSTAGGEGIRLAYETAAAAFMAQGNNRVILATDGDFNVGVSSDGELVRLIESERSRKIFLTVLGFGMGNYQDSKMQKLADSGNGNYAYIDSLSEAQKVLSKQMEGTLYAVAKDLKVQIEFNPALVGAYRLIGYEKRMLATQDFADDTKDAGELGAGSTVTALYEIVPPAAAQSGDGLRYQTTTPSAASGSGELMTLKFRYKKPTGEISALIERPVTLARENLADASPDFRFAAAVAEWGLILRRSEYRGNASLAQVEDLASGARGRDPDGYRAEFLGLVKVTRDLEGAQQH
ncbi:MAG TPA: VWA domain-containing protein, partial [Rectinemataceae bacterium]|nr:VWA domain-containing protein [Rectinemataceae bacterium]